MSSKIDYISLLVILIPCVLGYFTASIFFGGLFKSGLSGLLVTGLSALIGAVIGAIILKYVLKRKI
ncbi:MAG: hypothetical protein JW703_00005 [Candidatus Diapherotrites archaeon]|nr:hypothetical protein [Candidatus Diapherotrites archaeon]